MKIINVYINVYIIVPLMLLCGASTIHGMGKINSLLGSGIHAISRYSTPCIQRVLAVLPNKPHLFASLSNYISRHPCQAACVALGSIALMLKLKAFYQRQPDQNELATRACPAQEVSTSTASAQVVTENERKRQPDQNELATRALLAPAVWRCMVQNGYYLTGHCFPEMVQWLEGLYREGRVLGGRMGWASSLFYRVLNGWDARRIIWLSYSPDGKQIGSASLDGTIRLWDTERGGLLRRVNFHHSIARIKIVCYIPDYKLAASALPGGTISLEGIKNLRGIELVRVFEKNRPRNTMQLVRRPDGKQLASRSFDDGTIYLWDTVNTERTTPVMILDRGNGGCGLDYSPDSKQLASGSEDGTIRLWNLDIEPLISALRGPLDLDGALLLDGIYRAVQEGRKFTIRKYSREYCMLGSTPKKLYELKIQGVPEVLRRLVRPYIEIVDGARGICALV